MDLMELKARLTLDSSQYDEGLGRSEKSALSFGSKLKKGLGTVAKVGSIAMAGATAAYTYIGKKAFDAYANYEQLEGGIQTLFGTGGDSLEDYAKKQGKSVDKVRKKYELLQAGQSAVMENAARAWETTGLSMNQYMETVTGFSAALIRSTGGDTVEAARYADMAMQDMSDNANKMGTDIGSIQAAYQGFAKQNYTMLDNLKLGYGGTRTEMLRLIKDANKLRKKGTPKLSIKNYKDVVEAIRLIQEEMGITGTTAEEAKDTIQGSTNAMKAAWSNLLLGVADDNQDFDKLVGDFVTSFKNVSNNIMPRVKTILSGLGELFQAFADTILPQIINILVENAPQLAATAAQLIATLATALVKALPSLIRQIPVIITAIVGALKEAWPDIKQAGVDMLGELAAGLGSDTGSGDGSPVAVIATVVGNIAKKIIDSLPAIVEAGGDIIGAIADGMTGALTDDGEYAQSLDRLEETTIQKLWNLLKATDEWSAQYALPASQGYLDSIKELFAINWEDVKTGWVMLWGDIGTGIVNAWEDIKTKVATAWEVIQTKGSTFGTTVKTFFANTWESIKKTAVEKWGALKESISGKWEEIKTNAGEKLESIKETIATKAEEAKEKFLAPIDTLKEKVGEKWAAIKEKISEFIEKIKGLFNFEWKFPSIKLPHIYVKEYMTILGAKVPKKLGVNWYKKAYDEPYLFTQPTVIGNRGFGDGGGSGEMVYGRDALMRDIREAVGFGGGVTINVYQREGEDTMALSRRIEQDLLKLMQRGKAGALYV